MGNKYQKALDKLFGLSEITVKQESIVDEADLLQELVDRAMPVKPIYEIPYSLCPKCKFVDVGDFCEDCGQAIDWSKE